MSIPKSLQERIADIGCKSNDLYISAASIRDAFDQGAEALYALLMEMPCKSHDYKIETVQWAKVLLAARDAEIERLKEEIEDMKNSGALNSEFEREKAKGWEDFRENALSSWKDKNE